MARTDPPASRAALSPPARPRGLRSALAAAWAALVGRAEPLPAELIARHPELAEVRWRRGGLPPRVGGWCLGARTVHGITLGRTVFLAPGVGHPPGLLLHELAHARQFARDPGFPLRYAWESLRRGYARNRYETEADAFAHEALARRAGADARLGTPNAAPDARP